MNRSAQIGNYIYSTKPIGKGAFSRVYKGLNIETDEVIAIKLIDKFQLKQELIKRLQEEINLLAQLRHPNIAQFKNFIQDDDHFYIILEYCAGGDLAHRIKMGRIPEDDAKIYMRQMASALSYLKKRNIIHRDLKPQNLLLTADYNTLKITDFNFARQMYDDDLAQTFCGSPLYMAPEIIEKQEYNVKSDLWSVGIILYEMVYGNSPYAAANNIIELSNLIKHYTIPYNNIVSNHCNDLIDDLLQIEPNNRLDWKDFFSHPWLQGSLYDSIDNFETTSSQPISIPIDIRGRKPSVDILDNYVPIGVTPPKNTRSEPINMHNHRRSGNFHPGSAPNPRTVTDNIWSYMSSSAAVLKGAVDYISST